MISLKGSLSLCFSSSTVSGGGLIPLSSNSDATEAVRIDPDRNKSYQRLVQPLDEDFFNLQGAVSTSFPRWLAYLACTVGRFFVVDRVISSSTTYLQMLG